MLILRQKIVLILYPPFENSTTLIAIPSNLPQCSQGILMWLMFIWCLRRFKLGFSTLQIEQMCFSLLCATIICSFMAIVWTLCPHNVHNVRFCQYFFGSLSVQFSQNRWGRFKPKSFLHILFPQSDILSCFDSSKFSILGLISSKWVIFRCKNRLSLLGPEKLQKEHSKGKVSFSIL